MDYNDDSRDFAEIGEASDIEKITLQEAMRWVAEGVAFGVVHAGRWTPVERFSILDPQRVPHGATPLPQQYTLKDCYGTDIPTTEGSRGTLVSVYRWNR